MNSSRVFSFSAEPSAALRIHWIKKIQHKLFNIGFSIAAMCLVSQAYATNPASANTNTGTPTSSASAAAPQAAAGPFDMSKVPPILSLIHI